MFSLLGRGAAALPMLGGFTSRAGLGAVGGMGMGYASNLLSGANAPYSMREAALDGGLGAFGLFGVRRGLPSFATKRRAGLNFARGGALAGIPFTESPDLIDQLAPHGTPDDWGLLAKPAKGKPKKTAAPQGLLGGGAVPELMISAVPVEYQQSKAPVFNKTLKDFLADKQLQGLVNSNIFQMNKPLMDANKAEQAQRARDLQQNTYIGTGLANKAGERVAEAKTANAETEARAAARRALLAEQTKLAEGQVPITYMEGEAAKSKGDAQVAAANESAMGDALIDRLARAGENYLAELKGATEAQTQVTAKNIVDKADDQIKANVNQIRTNQMQRPTILGTLAAEQYKNAVDLHNMNMSQYNAGEDRRFKLASDNARSAFDAQVANANNAVALLGAAGEAEEPEDSPRAKGARATFDKLNTKISLLKTKLTPINKSNPEAPRKLYIQTDAGKKELRALQKERNRLMKQYGF